MATVNLKSSAGHLADPGKRMVAESMYAKGKSFLGAAVLLRRHGGDEYVVLHLICQGVEITLKALLLFKDYDHYWPRLRRPLGHNLIRIVTTASKESGLPPVSKDLATELEALNLLYSNHWLRYGTFRDILGRPDTIASDLTLHWIFAAICLADRDVAGKP